MSQLFLYCHACGETTRHKDYGVCAVCAERRDSNACGRCGGPTDEGACIWCGFSGGTTSGMPTKEVQMTDEVLTDALVKLRHRMQGEAVTLAPLEARALYMSVLRHTTPEQLADTEWAEQARAGRENVGLTSDPWGVAVREGDRVEAHTSGTKESR